MESTEQTNGLEGDPSLHWNKIQWQKVEKQVRRLQERIYRAAKRQQWQKVRSLQILLAKSYSNKLKAIRDVTQRNTGKTTPGVDNKVYDTPAKRWEVSQRQLNYQTHKPSPVKRIYIPKKDGSKRPLGIPTMDDRIVQAIIKTALEPEWEARFEPHSYGFRPGRCTMDAVVEIQQRLGRSKYTCWVLDADISKCFDMIAHEPLLNRVPVFRKLLSKWLKAGVEIFGDLTETPMGTPQGGIISPLLANIALDGMERLFQGTAPRGISLIRYADDFVVIATSKVILTRYVVPKLEQFFHDRGLRLNPEKTRIVHRTEGFVFLGFEFRYFEKRHNSLLLIRPAKANINEVLRTIKETFRQISYRPLEEIIPKINTIVRGWTNYYRYVHSKESFAYLQHRMFWIIWAGLKRRHDKNKSAKWLRKQYFTPNESNKWTLKTKKGNKVLFRPKSVRIQRFTSLNGLNSPYDRYQKSLWKERSLLNRAP